MKKRKAGRKRPEGVLGPTKRQLRRDETLVKLPFIVRWLHLRGKG